MVKNIKYIFLQIKRFISAILRHDPEKIGTKAIRLGMIVLGAFFLIFISWSILAPINSASIASGQIVLDFHKKTIQHLEGGIVEKISVKEGDNVITGQSLIYLQDIQTKSENKMLKKQLLTNLAIEERLKAQRDQKKPNFERILSVKKVDEAGKREILNIVQTQINLFNTKKESQQSKIDILNKRIDQLKDEIKGISAQKKAASKEIKVLYRQQKMSKKLVKSNNKPLNELLEIEKQIAVVEGRYGELEATIAKTNQTISETQLEIINLKNENLNETLDQLQEVEIKISDLTQQLIAAKDVLKRTIIKAPASGIVTDLKFHTVGAVINPGAEIMYIVPQDDELIVEAKVNPIDIDNIKAGLTAKVQLTAFKAKKVPKLTGEVSSVSADILVEEATAEQYFLARIKINEDEIKKLREDVKLYPGMPADAFIITGSRSLFQYLIDPIAEAGYKAFREE